MKQLEEFKSDVHSQTGEDGVLQEILRRIEENSSLDHWCVEFGAWDGVYLSNTCRLIREDGYNAVLIEGDPSRVEQLKVNMPQEEVHKICRFVNFEGVDSLDSILSETPIPIGFDFLSIDVDGVDYHVLNSLKKFRPKVVCIEFNPTIPNAVDFVQPRDFSVNQGSSAKAIVRLANEKGYSLIAATEGNLFLVRDEYKDLVPLDERSLERLNPQGNDPQFIFVGFDGTLLSNKEAIPFLWHGYSVPMSKVQFFPGFLRKLRCDMGFFRGTCYYAFFLMRRPRQFLSSFKAKRHSSPVS